MNSSGTSASGRLGISQILISSSRLSEAAPECEMLPLDSCEWCDSKMVSSSDCVPFLLVLSSSEMLRSSSMPPLTCYCGDRQTSCEADSSEVPTGEEKSRDAICLSLTITGTGLGGL